MTCDGLLQLILLIALNLVLLNKLRCQGLFKFSASQITLLNGKQCGSRSVGFFRSQLIWIYTVCIGRIYHGSAGQRLRFDFLSLQMDVLIHKKHPDELLRYLFKIYQEKMLCDTIIHTPDGGAFQAHKIIVTASSTYLHNILSQTNQIHSSFSVGK